MTLPGIGAAGRFSFNINHRDITGLPHERHRLRPKIIALITLNLLNHGLCKNIVSQTMSYFPLQFSPA
jgi:hypothetical protein